MREESSVPQLPRRNWRKIILFSVAGLLLLLIFAGSYTYQQLMPGAVFLKRVMDSSESAQTAGEPFREWETTATRDGRKVRVRVYQPVNGHDRAVLLIHGLHWGGYDEERLVPFARKLAGMRLAVVTPDLVDLKAYEIVPRTVDEIEQVALWALEHPEIVPESSDGKLGMMGICFSGALGLSAATRPTLRDRLAYVFAFGGHGDLDRTMEFLVTGLGPDGEKVKVHPYGQTVVLRHFAHHFAPVGQVQQLRECLLDLLHGEDQVDEEQVQRLNPKVRKYFQMARDWKTDELGELLGPAIRGTRSPDVLSPERLPPPGCPVFLLHGSVDNVVHPSESESLSRWASKAGPTRVLISPLVVHVELEEGMKTGCWDEWDVATFWSEMLKR